MSEPKTGQVVDILFDGPPGPEGPRFIEVESPPGHSINFGEWVEREGALWAIRFQNESKEASRLCTAMEEARKDAEARESEYQAMSTLIEEAGFPNLRALIDRVRDITKQLNGALEGIRLTRNWIENTTPTGDEYVDSEHEEEVAAAWKLYEMLGVVWTPGHSNEFLAGRKDTQRLDWLDAQGPEVVDHPWDSGPDMWGVESERYQHTSDSIRVAIDAAMSSRRSKQ